MNPLYEGKAKKVFDIGDHYLVEFKDSLTAFNAQKKGSFQGKGSINRRISSLLFAHLRQHQIATHWLADVGENQMRVQKLQMLSLEVVVRNVWAGSLAQKFHKPEGEDLPKPLVEFYYKKDELNDPLISESHIEVLGLASPDEVAQLKTLALKINDLLKTFFLKARLRLVDFKVEFGKDEQGRLVLGDEISPDSCRLWDLETQKKMDKDRFRRDLGEVDEVYSEVLKRLQGVAL